MSPAAPIWIDRRAVILIHEAQLAEHGGPSGIRDMAILESALSAPEQLHHYQTPDLYDLAACYGYRLANNHPFVDGNKRTAWVCTRLFLKLNGTDIEATIPEKIAAMLRVAAGEATEREFGEWLRGRGRSRELC